MLNSLLQHRRTRHLAQAIKQHDVDRMRALLDQGVNFGNFKGKWPEPIPHALHDNYRTITDVLEWAAHCELPLAGFEALLDAGADISVPAYHRALHQTNMPNPTWDDVHQVADILSPDALQARQQGAWLRETTAPAPSSKTHSRL